MSARRAIGAMFFAIFGAIWLVWEIAVFLVALRQYQRNRIAHHSEADLLARKTVSRMSAIRSLAVNPST